MGLTSCLLLRVACLRACTALSYFVVSLCACLQGVNIGGDVIKLATDYGVQVCLFCEAGVCLC